jgi:hypothetical protein
MPQAQVGGETSRVYLGHCIRVYPRCLAHPVLIRHHAPIVLSRDRQSETHGSNVVPAGIAPRSTNWYFVTPKSVTGAVN